MIVWVVMEGEWEPYLKAVCKTKEIAEAYVLLLEKDKHTLAQKESYSIEDWEVLEKGEQK